MLLFTSLEHTDKMQHNNPEVFFFFLMIILQCFLQQRFHEMANARNDRRMAHLQALTSISHVVGHSVSFISVSCWKT